MVVPFATALGGLILGAHYSKPGSDAHHWKDDATIVEVRYGASGRVAAVDCYYYVDPGPEELFDNLRWRAKRVWRKWF